MQKTLEKGNPFGNMSWKPFSQMDWMSGKWLYFDIYLSSLFVILTHNLYWKQMAVARTFICLGKRFYFIHLIYLFTLFMLYILIFSFLNMVFYCYHRFYLFTLIMSPQTYSARRESLWLIHFKCIPGCCELTKNVSTHTCFLNPQYNLISALLLLGW